MPKKHAFANQDYSYLTKLLRSIGSKLSSKQHQCQAVVMHAQNNSLKLDNHKELQALLCAKQMQLPIISQLTIRQ